MENFTDNFSFKVSLPLEEGKTYDTKFQTKMKFTITKINTAKDGKIVSIQGFYDDKKYFICPINVDRIIPEITEKHKAQGAVANTMNEYYKSLKDFSKIVKGTYTEEEKEIIAEHIKNLFL